jgi:hypothetical protein
MPTKFVRSNHCLGAAVNYKTFDEDYSDFVEEVKHCNRSFLSDKSLEFLAWLEAVAKKHEITLTPGQQLFRARKSEVKGELIPETGMKPKKNLGSTGRANALNIPVLYLADHPEIAISEIRPETGDHVTVAVMEIQRELKIIDFAGERPDYAWYFQYHKLKGEEAAYHENDCLVRIGGEFSKALSISDKTIEYIPTQVIADFFKHHGYDGIAYQSQFQVKDNESLWRNYALFDLDSANILRRELYQVNSVILHTQKIEHKNLHRERFDEMQSYYN